MTRGLLWIGKLALSLCREVGGMALLLAYTIAMLLRGKFDGRELVKSLYKMGVVSVPIVALTALFTGGTMVIQSGIFVQRFQAYGLLGWGTGYAVLREVGPMAVSSANISGRPAATTAEEAQHQLGDLVDVYLDAGPSGAQAASTIVDLTGPEPRILREGPISTQAVADVLGTDVASLSA